MWIAQKERKNILSLEFKASNCVSMKIFKISIIDMFHPKIEKKEVLSQHLMQHVISCHETKKDLFKAVWEFS